MNKLLLVLVASLFAIAACDKVTVTPAPTYVEGQGLVPASTGPTKTRAEVLKELADFRATCKATPNLIGCNESGTELPIVGTAKTRAEVSAELAAFRAECKAKPTTEGCQTAP